MKRIYQKLTGTYLALVILLGITTLAWAATNFLPQYHNKGTVGSAAKQWQEGHFQAIYSRNSDGTVDYYKPANRVVYINKASQLTTWSGQAATAGQSYFQTEPGKIYVVDLEALYKSGVTDGNGVSAFSNVVFSGVSAILPDAGT